MTDDKQHTVTAAEQAAIFHPLDGHHMMPAGMNDPFYYEPHPLCLLAREKAMPMIQELMQGETEGKMFGVLIVERQEDCRCGFLVGYSG